MTFLGRKIAEHVKWCETWGMRRRALGRGYRRYITKDICWWGGIYGIIVTVTMLIKWLLGYGHWWNRGDVRTIALVMCAAILLRLILELLPRQIFVSQRYFVVAFSRGTKRIYFMSDIECATLEEVDDKVAAINIVLKQTNGYTIRVGVKREEAEVIFSRVQEMLQGRVNSA